MKKSIKKLKKLIIDKNWLIEHLKKKIDEIDWETIKLDIEPFLLPQDLKLVENWDKDIFYGILAKLDKSL